MNSSWVVQFIVVLSLLATTYGVGTAGYIYNMSSAAIDAQGNSDMVMDTFGDGLWASLKVETADCPSYCMVRLERYVGLYNGNRLRVEFRLGKVGDNNTIEYRVREMDFSGNTIRDLMRGYFGSRDGQNWTIGETVDLAVALEGSEFIFYVAGMGQIAKLQLLGSIIPFQTPLAWRISVWSETANDYMEVTASGFKAIDVSGE